MKKPERKITATRSHFVEAFCELYKVSPIEKITVKELAQKAGYSRATFYNNFKDVYELREIVENAFIDSLLETITKNIKSYQTFDYFVDAFVGLVQSKEIYLDVFMNTSAQSSFVERLKEKAVPLLLLAFEVQSNQTIARYALEFYISGMVSVMGHWLKCNQDLSIETFACLIKGILQEGILKQIIG